MFFVPRPAFFFRNSSFSARTSLVYPFPPSSPPFHLSWYVTFCSPWWIFFCCCYFPSLPQSSCPFCSPFPFFSPPTLFLFIIYTALLPSIFTYYPPRYPLLFFPPSCVCYIEFQILGCFWKNRILYILESICDFPRVTITQYVVYVEFFFFMMMTLWWWFECVCFLFFFTTNAVLSWAAPSAFLSRWYGSAKNKNLTMHNFMYLIFVAKHHFSPGTLCHF